MSFAARALLLAVRVYQAFLSPLMPSACKFYPSCSHYAAESLRIHGARRGAWLALRRLARCHPFSRGGVDLVPDPPALPDEPGRTSFSLSDFPSERPQQGMNENPRQGENLLKFPARPAERRQAEACPTKATKAHS